MNMIQPIRGQESFYNFYKLYEKWYQTDDGDSKNDQCQSTCLEFM